MLIVKARDPAESSAEALHLPTEVRINKLVKSDKVINSSSWKYITEFILDVIKTPEVGAQEIPTPHQVHLWQSMRRCQE